MSSRAAPVIVDPWPIDGTSQRPRARQHVDCGDAFGSAGAGLAAGLSLRFEKGRRRVIREWRGAAAARLDGLGSVSQLKILRLVEAMAAERSADQDRPGCDLASSSRPRWRRASLVGAWLRHSGSRLAPAWRSGADSDPRCGTRRSGVNTPPRRSWRVRAWLRPARSRGCSSSSAGRPSRRSWSTSRARVS